MLAVLKVASFRNFDTSLRLKTPYLKYRDNIYPLKSMFKVNLSTLSDKVSLVPTHGGDRRMGFASVSHVPVHGKVGL